MIKAEILENDDIQVSMRGTGGDLSEELGAIIHDFAEKILGMTEEEFLNQFVCWYQQTKEEAQNETDVH